jgi:hypothetical protein
MRSTARIEDDRPCWQQRTANMSCGLVACTGLLQIWYLCCVIDLVQVARLKLHVLHCAASNKAQGWHLWAFDNAWVVLLSRMQEQHGWLVAVPVPEIAEIRACPRLCGFVATLLVAPRRAISACVY